MKLKTNKYVGSFSNIYYASVWKKKQKINNKSSATHDGRAKVHKIRVRI